MTDTTAEVVETREPPSTRFPEAWAVQCLEADRSAGIYTFLKRSAADNLARRPEFVRVRILKLPSEAEAARQPLVDEVNRCAVELANVVSLQSRGITECLSEREEVLAYAYRSAVAALAEHDKGTKP